MGRSGPARGRLRLCRWTLDGGSRLAGSRLYRHSPSRWVRQLQGAGPPSYPDPTRILFGPCPSQVRRRLQGHPRSTRARRHRRLERGLCDRGADPGHSAAERRAVRQAETKPIMVALKTTLMTALAELPSRSSLVEAIKYMLGHWAGLTVFLEDGRIEVDTNTVERTMRPIALGRKNALFAGSQSGARTWAI